MNKKETEHKLEILDLPKKESDSLRALRFDELLHVVGGLKRIDDSGYVCSAPSNDCQKL